MSELLQGQAESIPLPPAIDLSVIQQSAQFDATGNEPDQLAKLEAKTKFKDAERGEEYRTHIHIIVVAAIYLIALLMIAFVIVRAWHLVMPEKYRWLGDGENHNIERIIFSGIIFSLATKYFKRYKIFGD